MRTYVTSGRLWEVKNRRKLQTASYESDDAVIYKRWSFSRGSSYINLTWIILVFWKSGWSREVVA